jgi:hypothetical protein
MESAYQPELWQNIWVVLGSSSAALIGLLFIATSLHLDEIVSNPILSTQSGRPSYAFAAHPIANCLKQRVFDRAALQQNAPRSGATC